MGIVLDTRLLELRCNNVCFCFVTVRCVCKFFLFFFVDCYLFCLCVVLCSSGQGRTAVADCPEVKFINQIKSIKMVLSMVSVY